MPSTKKRKGPHSQKSQKQKKSAGQNRKKARSSGETNQPFETDTKRRIGQHMGTGRPPLMKK